MTMLSSLSPTQHQVLRTLAQSASPMRVDEIGSRIDLHGNTVREVLATLQEKDLVSRTQASAAGRGRPSWLYQATVTTDPLQIAQEFANFSAAVALQISEFAPDPQQSALELGQAWGRQILKQQHIPDHGQFDADRAVAVDLDVHSGKIRLFLSALGFEAHPGADVTTIDLFQCPIINANTERPDLVCQMHRGMMDHIVTTLSRGRLSTSLEPHVEPNLCRVVLIPEIKIRSSLEQAEQADSSTQSNSSTQSVT